ncbi:MAG: DUF4426 domain-containing protein [Pseudomonadales bacterium]|jgi:hypothetical protein|nr:DUF4426 domain-containing protein [Pseudomonadales bacterium]MDP6469453.1 DUF4426 domain-containing protein [Pseudomonadales bacterium]MDP6827295.1 DUF4426 domain-containing protein [Pseudomonadales bacterium]MDP6971118.1 DUF4426 domain-containing protein [Pseudomonadales bacterium]|tara:strand:- start:1053 stop:1466 length:414 start_codon:yes stop_codon:yes gene_type:complete
MIVMLMCVFASPAAIAEQMQRLGPWAVHYIALPSTTLNPSIAAQYGIRRARDIAFVNISILDDEGRATTAVLEGSVTNLLSQQTTLTFTEVVEGQAVYYLTTLRYTDQELLAFHVEITPPDDRTHTLTFGQKIYRDE